MFFFSQSAKLLFPQHSAQPLELFCRYRQNDSAAHGFWLVCFFVLLFYTEWKVADNGKITSENGDMEKASGNLFTGGFLCLGGERTCFLGVAQGVSVGAGKIALFFAVFVLLFCR